MPLDPVSFNLIKKLDQRVAELEKAPAPSGFTMKSYIDTLLDPNIIFIYWSPPTEKNLSYGGTGGAWVSVVSSDFTIHTPAGTYEMAYAMKNSGLRYLTETGPNPLWMSFDYPIRMFVSIQTETTTNTDQILWIVAGNYGNYYNNASVTVEHIGIKIVNDTLYATVADGTAESTAVLQSPVDASGILLEIEIKYYPGSRVEFSGYYYSNSTGETIPVSATITTNLPSGMTMYVVPYISVYNSSTTEEKYLHISKWLFAQAINADDIM